MPLSRQLTKFTTVSPTLASYDWTDIDEGTGYVVYNGTKIAIDATPANDEYVLTKQTFQSTEASTASPWDINFDVTFNTPKTVKGYLYLLIPIRCDNTTLASRFRVIHYDGTTETEIIASTAFESLIVVADVSEYRIFKVLLPETQFAAGTTFRWEYINDGIGANWVYHDPTASETTKFPKMGGALYIHIPFELDL